MQFTASANYTDHVRQEWRILYGHGQLKASLQRDFAVQRWVTTVPNQYPAGKVIQQTEVQRNRKPVICDRLLL